MKPKIEYRVVCAHFGTRHHSTHKFPKGDGKKATQSVIDLNHHSEMASDDIYYKHEAPYRVQTREVSAWSYKEE